MNLAGEHRFSASRDVVWQCLLDQADLRAAIPGCERLVATAPDAYEVTVTIGISSIKGTYSGQIAVVDRDPVDSYRLRVRGSGRPGSVHGDALMTLSDSPAGTLVRYDADVRAEGAIARLGSRLLGGTAKLMIGQFMSAMERQVAGRKAANAAS